MRSRRRQQIETDVFNDVWPGFVDAFATVIMVITFLLTLFVVSQHFMNDAIMDQDGVITQFRTKIERLSTLLGLAQTEQKKLTADLMAETHVRQTQATQLGSLQTQVGALNNNVQSLTALLKTSTDELAQAQEQHAVKDANIQELTHKLDVAMVEKMQELASYRSEFFGKLKALLGDREDMKIVGDRFVFQSEVLFTTGSANLSAVGLQRVAQLAKTLQEIGGQIPETIPWILRVDGHTDSRPMHSERFPSNWELSFARAMAVVRTLRKNGLAPERLAATGFGEHQPIAAGKTTADYTANRRIEFKLDRR